jgi:hypothetical protein
MYHSNTSAQLAVGCCKIILDISSELDTLEGNIQRHIRNKTHQYYKLNHFYFF